MTRTVKIATLMVLTLCITSVAVAQSTTEVIVHRTGTVVAKYDGKVAVQMDDGSVREFTPKPGKTVMVDGVPTTYETLKVGTVLAADFVKTETTTPVTTTTIKNAKVMKVVGNTIIVQNTDGTFKKHTVPSGFKFLVEGKETEVSNIREGMNLTATIVSVKTETTTTSEIKTLGGVAPVQPPAPVVAPPPPPAPPPAPEPKLPKTGSPLPLAALGGALSLLAGLGVRSFRRSR